jgi:hypothetical protein
VGMLRARPPKSPLQQTFPARQLHISQLPRQFTPHAHTPATQHFVQRTFHSGFAMRKVLSLATFLLNTMVDAEPADYVLAGGKVTLSIKRSPRRGGGHGKQDPLCRLQRGREDILW